jgi:hypothetical protein
MRRLVLLLAVLVLIGGASAPAQGSEECTWGASSVIVVDGVQSEPATSGCIPR